ncbi:hypothetical protein IIA79_04345 [bacterium]|nr:hypothetical protein [bacterium]
MRFVALLILGLAIALPAWAYAPDPGTQATPVIGWDMIEEETISMKEMQGKWVFLKFWASW